MSDKSIILPDGTVRPISEVGRTELLDALRHQQAYRDEWLRRQIIRHNRIDILSNEILGRELQPFHINMLQFQFKHPESLQLAFRGGGKCLGLGTLVMLADGSTRPVEDIRVGDRLMGPDGEKRTVVDLGRGSSQLYRIRPSVGGSWVCNDEHILTLKDASNGEGTVKDFPVKEVIAMIGGVGCWSRNIPWKQFRVPVGSAEALAKDTSWLQTEFQIEEAGFGDYYGFTLDGDGRFLLGDGTVTHNTSSCTVTKIIHYIIKNRDIRICLVSKTKGTAESILKEIKGHLETNEELIRIFGEFYDPHKVSKWDNSEIEVTGRSKVIREGSVTCVGVDSQIVSKHYDVIIMDDVIDEENARTKHLRDKTRTWYYTTLMPTLEPPDPSFEHRGEQHILGTRYHYDDLYGHLIKNELAEHHNIIPALDEHGRSPWPEKYPAEWFLEKRRKAGKVIFDSQYQNNTEAMKGEVFRYDDCQQLNDKEYPKVEDLKVFVGVDLAISQKDTADQFAIVAIGVLGDIADDSYQVFVLDFYAGQLRFSQQTEKIVSFYKKWDPITCLIESNAYQLAQIQQLQDKHPGLRVQPHITDKDKMTRAWKLSPLFEQGRVFFKKTHGPVIDQLVLFPNHKYKDLFDALDLAITAIKARKRRKKRRERAEPGIIKVGGGRS